MGTEKPTRTVHLNVQIDGTTREALLVALQVIQADLQAGNKDGERTASYVLDSFWEVTEDVEDPEEDEDPEWEYRMEEFEEVGKNAVTE